MGVPYNITKRVELGGLDLRTSDLLMAPENARAMSNYTRRITDTGTQRRGFKVVSDNSGNNGGFGFVNYQFTNSTTGAVSNELLVMGQTLYKIETGTFNIAYAGSDVATYEIYFDSTTTNSWHLRLIDDSVEVLDEDLDVGFDEASPLTMAGLKTAVDAITDFSATITGTTTVPAAFLPLTETSIIAASGSVDITFYYTTEVNYPTGSTEPFDSSFNNRNADYFENITTAQVNNLIFFSNGFDPLKKYDGSDVYNAGISAGVDPTIALGGGTGITDTGVNYIQTYVQKDAKGNIVEGVPSGVSNSVSPSNQDIDVTVTNIEDDTGYNTDCAIVAGAQGPVTTITVDNGSGGSQTLKVGQTAYFYDAVEGDYVEREITAVTSGSITIDGAGVTVADNAVISNNLRIALYRNTASGTTYSFVVEIPNNSFATTQVYTDSTTPANLGADFINPADAGAEHGVPPIGKYISTVQGRLVIAGKPNAASTVYFSDLEGPEYFPAAYNFLARGSSNGPITGLSSGNDLFWVFKKDNSMVVTGELLPNKFTLETISKQVGCVAHATIQEFKGLIYWLGRDGVYRAGLDVSEFRNQAAPEEVSEIIFPLFKNTAKASTEQLKFSRAVAIVDDFDEKYLITIPTETTTGSDVWANSNTPTYVYDLRRDAWYQWNNLNMVGGVATDEEDMYWVERVYSTFDSNMQYKIYKRDNTELNAGFIDHNIAIDFSYTSGWNSLGEPSVFKKALRWKGYAMDTEFSPNYSIAVTSEHDFIKDLTESSFTANFGTGNAEGGWGSGLWGSFPWGHPNDLLSDLIKLKSKKNQSIRFKFKHSTIGERVLLTGYELEWALAYNPFIKE